MGDPAENKDRTLRVDGLVNGRDLGGLRRLDGTVTPRGVFFRSENVDWITGNGWQQIHDAGIRTVIDLRQQGERDTGVRFHCMGGRDGTGLLAMALLHAIGTDPECIVDDYLETVRRGDERAARGKRNNVEPRLEELCRQHGTTTEGAFRDALGKFDLQAFLDAAELADKDREGLFTWRGAATPQTGNG